MGVVALCLVLVACGRACVVSETDGDAAALSSSNAPVSAGPKAFSVEGVKA